MTEFWPKKATERLNYLALTEHLEGLQRSVAYSVEYSQKYTPEYTETRLCSRYDQAVSLAKDLKEFGKKDVKIVTVLTVRDKGIEVV